MAITDENKIANSYDKMPRKNKGLWVPRELLYATKLKLSERIILAEIDVLDCTSNGCYASNRHFSQRFGLSKKQVSIIINRLAKMGFITSDVLKRKGKNGGYERSIRIVPETCEKLLTEHLTPIPEKGDSLSPKTTIPYPRKGGSPIPEKGDKEYKSKTNISRTFDLTGKTERKISQKDLALVLTKKATEYELQLHKIMPARDRSERTTYSRIKNHLVGMQDPEIFDKAINWAKECMVSGAFPRKLFVATIKQETGFKATGLKLLNDDYAHKLIIKNQCEEMRNTAH